MRTPETGGWQAERNPDDGGGGASRRADPSSGKNVGDLERRAFHEAGHAVVALREGRTIKSISIDRMSSVCAYTGDDGSPESARAELRISLAGKLAEEFAVPMNVASGLSEDEEIFGTPQELAHLDAMARLDAEQGPAASDSERSASLVNELGAGDSELEIQRELAWRALVIDSVFLHRLAGYLLAWRTLLAGDIEEIRHESETT